MRVPGETLSVTVPGSLPLFKACKLNERRREPENTTQGRRYVAPTAVMWLKGSKTTHDKQARLIVAIDALPGSEVSQVAGQRRHFSRYHNLFPQDTREFVISLADAKYYHVRYNNNEIRMALLLLSKMLLSLNLLPEQIIYDAMY